MKVVLYYSTSAYRESGLTTPIKHANPTPKSALSHSGLKFPSSEPIEKEISSYWANAEYDIPLTLSQRGMIKIHMKEIVEFYADTLLSWCIKRTKYMPCMCIFLKTYCLCFLELCTFSYLPYLGTQRQFWENIFAEKNLLFFMSDPVSMLAGIHWIKRL